MRRIGKPGRLYLAGLLCVLMRPLLAMGQGGSAWENYKNAALEAYEQGNNAEAERLFKNSLAEAEKQDRNDRRVASSLQLLGDFYLATARHLEASEYSGRLLDLLTRNLGPDHPALAVPLRLLAKAKQGERKYVEVEQLFRRALAVLEKAAGADPSTAVASVCEELAGFYVTRQRYSEAESLYRRSLLILENAFGPNDPPVAAVLNNLAGVNFAQGNFTAAEPLYKRSLAILEQAFGPQHPNTAPILTNYASVLRKIGRTAEAVELEARAKAILSRLAQSHSR